MARSATNKLLQKAKKSKSDEFYTQYSDIESCNPPLKPTKLKQNNSSLNCTYLNIQ